MEQCGAAALDAGLELFSYREGNGQCNGCADGDSMQTSNNWHVYTCEECVDNENGCPEWASTGECAANPDYMLQTCMLSCGECEVGGGGSGDQG